MCLLSSGCARCARNLHNWSTSGARASECPAPTAQAGSKCSNAAVAGCNFHRSMGNRRRFREFLRKQEATTAYKRALADASDSLKKFGSLPVAVHRPRPHSSMVRTQNSAAAGAHSPCLSAKSEHTEPCCLLAQSTFRSSADGSILLDVSRTHLSAHEEIFTASARHEPSTRSGLRARTHTHSCVSQHPRRGCSLVRPFCLAECDWQCAQSPRTSRQGNHPLSPSCSSRQGRCVRCPCFVSSSLSAHLSIPRAHPLAVARSSPFPSSAPGLPTQLHQQ